MGRLAGNGDSNSLDPLCGGSRCVSFGAASANANLSTAHNHRQTTNWNSWLTHSVATNSNDNTNSFLHCNHINSRSISSSSRRLLLQPTANSNQQPTADCRFETSQQQTTNSQQPTSQQPTASSQQSTADKQNQQPTASSQQPTASSQQPSRFCVKPRVIAEESDVCCLQASVTATRKEQHTAAKTTRPGQDKLNLGTSVRPLRSLRQQVIAVLYCVCWRVQQS
jgi:hypothetical protein